MEKKTYIHPAMAMKAIAEDLMAAISQNTNNADEEGSSAEVGAKEENFGADEEHKSVW